MKPAYWILGLIVLLIAFLVWVNWPTKKAINPAWQADYDAAINAGYSKKEAEDMATKVYPKYVLSQTS